MARIVVNSFFREILGNTADSLRADAYLELSAATVRDLLATLDAEYPGSGKILMRAAVAIDGDIYTHALAVTLNDDTELVFIPAIEGG